MLNIMFFIKTLLMTIAIVLVLQIKIGRFTLEDHARHFIQTSSLVAPLQSVASSGAMAIREGFSFVSHEVSQHVRGHWLSAERDIMHFHRSRAYVHAQGQIKKVKERLDHEVTP